MGPACSLCCCAWPLHVVAWACLPGRACCRPQAATTPAACPLPPSTLFSWDPIFEAEGFGQTYAEMDKEVRGAERLECVGWQMGLRLLHARGWRSGGSCGILPSGSRQLFIATPRHPHLLRRSRTAFRTATGRWTSCGLISWTGTQRRQRRPMGRQAASNDGSSMAALNLIGSEHTMQSSRNATDD